MKKKRQQVMSKNDEKEFELFYKKFYRRMISVAYKILGDRFLAEDAVSDALLRMIKSWKSINILSEEQKDYYAFISAKNAALNVMKKEEMYIDSVEFDDNLLSDENLNNASDEYIIEQMKHLSSKDREILYLKYSMGLDYKAISGVIGITVTAARKRVQYAKKNLAKLLKDGGVSLE